MKRYIIITLALALGALALHAQDTIRDYPTKYPEGLWRLTPDSVSHYRPHNDYSGLNSLLMRLANPFWDGKGYKIPDIGTGLRIEDGKIRPLTTRKESADDPSPVTLFARGLEQPVQLFVVQAGHDFLFRPDSGNAFSKVAADCIVVVRNLQDIQKHVIV